jgi:hypothetical protein
LADEKIESSSLLRMENILRQNEAVESKENERVDSQNGSTEIIEQAVENKHADEQTDLAKTEEQAVEATGDENLDTQKNSAEIVEQTVERVEKKHVDNKKEKANIEKRREILSKLDTLIKNQSGDLTDTLSEFRKLQTEWKSVENRPQSKANDLWKEYNYYLEQFYDLIKINNDLREYDFKKNLELKTQLCEKAESLIELEDSDKAYKILQKLHQEWREIGPVAKDLRDEIWNRFKNASDTVKRKRAEMAAELEETNAKLDAEIREEKEKIFAFIESIDLAELTNYKAWEKAAEEIKELNKKFSAKNLSDRVQNQELYKRLRTACDAFFAAKNNFYAKKKEESQAGLEKKRQIVQRAEELKESTEWKEATDKFIALQKEWKAVGATSHKASNALWEKFSAACNYFFDRRKEIYSTKKDEEKNNLTLKKEIIEKVEKYELSGKENEDMNNLKELYNQFREIGYVPFKDKNKINDKFKEVLDAQYDKIRAKYRTNTKNYDTMSRPRLMKQYEQLKQEIATYENNMGFLSSSKKTSSIVKDLERKIKTLNMELNSLLEQINTLDAE